MSVTYTIEYLQYPVNTAYNIKKSSASGCQHTAFFKKSEALMSTSTLQLQDCHLPLK